MNYAPSPDQANSGISPGWKNPPTVMILRQDLEMSKPMHDEHSRRVGMWNDLLRVRGSAKAPEVKNRSRIQPKVIRRQAEWRYSALSEPFLGSSKLFQVKPSTFEDTASARQNEMILNWQFRTKLNRVKFVDDYVRSVVDDGSAIVRVGWKRATVMVNERVPVYDHLEIQSEEQLNEFKQALEMQAENFREFDEKAPPEMKAALDFYKESGTPSVAIQKGETTTKVEKILENYPTAEMVDPNNFYLDPSCGGDLAKALFAVVSFETSKAELLKEPKRYKNLENVNWETATPVTDTDHSSGKNDYSQNFTDVLRKKVIAYEYWGLYDINKTGELKPIVVTWIGDVIVRMEESPFPDQKIPFVVVPYLPVKREVFGEPDAEILEDNQKIIGAVSRGMIDLLGRSANGQQGFAKGFLDPLNRRRYDQGQDYEFNPVMASERGLIEHKYPEIPNSAMLMIGLQNQDAEALTGVKSFSGGISGQAYGEVAAGIRGALDAASKREMAILRRLAQGIVEIGIKWASMNAVFLSEKETVRVTNDQFVEVKREDLKGNFDLKVDISTAEVDDAQAKDLGFMLQTIGPDMETEIRMMILAEIAELKRMPELAKKLLSWKPTPDPIMEEMKKLQLEELRMKVDELRSKANLNDAKAREAGSNADGKDLDFVETETGTKHAREMEKSQAQAQGNQALQVTKALTSPRKEGEKEPDIEQAVGFNELSKKLDGHSSSTELERGAPPVDNTVVRDELVGQGDPRYSIGSRFYDPSADPTANPGLNLGE